MTESTNPRTVVVTGGSRGIGRAICLAFAQPDTHVYFNYLASAEGAAATVRQVIAAGGRAVGAPVDMASEKEVRGFLERVVDETGRIDVLVNNAGITRDGLVVRMKEDDWDRVLDVNLKGVFFATKVAARVMMKQRYGRIINMASVVGVTGNPGQANYVAAKAGLIGFTKSIARELAPRGITVNAVAPGYVETDMTACLTDAQRNAMLGQIPLGRAGQAEEVAAMVKFLASDQAAYITGQAIHVSGGLHM